MNKLLAAKKLTPKHKKEKNSCAISRKYKDNKVVKTRIRKAVKKNILSRQFTENENSKKDLYDNFVVKSRSPKTPKILESNDSVIYVSTTYKSDLPDYTKTPTVDLCNSAEKLKSKDHSVNSKQLQTIFFSKRNFERDISLTKTLGASSLITFPVIKKIVPKKHNSSTVIGKYHSKVSILDIPPQFLSWKDLNYDINMLKKYELTESDHQMIHWILKQENENIEIDVTLTSSSSGDNSSLNTDISLEEMINIYEVSPKDFN